MPLRCPVCRALVEHGPQCRRCRADLSMLFALEDQRRQMLLAAYRCFARGEWEQVLALAHDADALRRDEETTRLVACACLLRRDFPGAWLAYQSIPAAG
jgi:hypothetical protein